MKVDRKHKIVLAAIECFKSLGVAQTRLNEIAERAKVDPPLLKYYFPTLDSLYMAVVEEILERLKNRSLRELGRSKKKPNPRSTLIAYCEGTISWVQEERGLFTLWMYFYHLASFDSRFSALSELIRNNGRERIAQMIYQCIESEDIPAQHIKVSDLAIAIQAHLSGYAILFGTEKQLDLRHMIDVFFHTLDLILNPKKSFLKTDKSA